MTTAKKLGVTKLSSAAPALQKPLVLLRGLGRTSAFWLDFPRYLSEKANVVMIDLPGGGQSPSLLGRGSIDDLAGDVFFTLEQEGLLGSHLLGISLGGMVAATVAHLAERRSPNRNNAVGSLIIVNSSARYTKQKRIAPVALVKMFWQLLKPRLYHRNFSNYLVSKNCLALHPQLPEVWDGLWRAEKIRKLPVFRQLLAAAKFLGEQVYREMQTPVLFLASEQDDLVSWTNSIALWHTVKGAQLKTYKVAGHDLTTELPGKVAADILTFCLQNETVKEQGFDGQNSIEFSKHVFT